MNKDVTVTGMEVRTKVGSNLLIAPDGYDLATSTSDNQDSKYRTYISQLRSCLLEPSSTADGVGYWYTVQASADGNKLSGASWIGYNETGNIANPTAGKTNYDDEFNAKYLTKPDGGFSADTIAYTDANAPGAAYGYVDYNFYIKATNDTANQKVAMTKCNLQYNNTPLTTSGSVPNVDRAWRVAMFVQEATQAADVTTAPTADNCITVLKLADAVYQDSSKGVSGANATTAVAKLDNAANFPVVHASNTGVTAYYKVTVRLWLEGEDTSCTSETYAKLTNDYALDLEFKLLDSADNGVTNIATSTWKGKSSGV